MQEYLTDIEIDKIEQFCKDETLYEAVRKVMLAQVFYAGALKKGQKFEPRNQAFDVIDKAYRAGTPIDNESLGADLRALYSGVDMVEQGFGNLKTIKKETKEIETPYNEAV